MTGVIELKIELGIELTIVNIRTDQVVSAEGLADLIGFHLMGDFNFFDYFPS